MSRVSDEIDRKKEKLDLTLLPATFLEEVSKVLVMGAEKHERFGYLDQPDYDVQAWRALLRHVVAIGDGELEDGESGLDHVAHIAANCAILLHLKQDRRGLSREWPQPVGPEEQWVPQRHAYGKPEPEEVEAYGDCARCGVPAEDHHKNLTPKYPHDFVSHDSGSMGLA